MQYFDPDAGPSWSLSVDSVSSAQMPITEWDVLFDSERFEEIDDEGNVVPREPIDCDLDTENALYDAFTPHIEETLMDEVIDTFSSPRFSIREGMDNGLALSSTRRLASSNSQMGLSLLRFASALPHSFTTRLLGPNSAYPSSDTFSSRRHSGTTNPRANESLYHYQKLFLRALSQAASVKSRHHRKPKENVSGGSSSRRKTRPYKETTSRYRGRGSGRSIPTMSAAVKTRLRMDLEDYRDSSASFGRQFFGDVGPGPGSTPTSESGSGFGFEPRMTPMEDEDLQGTIEVVEDDSSAGFIMQVEALSDRFSGAFISER